LESFVAGHDETAEASFAALVERHGAMVLGVCRRVLGNHDAAEDAFQATFLVLARKAGAIARREQLASWLHGVARRAALDARARATRQAAREKRLGAMFYVEPPDHTMLSELRGILDDELARLPERHRAPVVLCELEGLSRRDAAARLKISEGTLSSRLARAKARLRERLTKRGFAISAATLTLVLTQYASAVIIPPALVDSTIRVATLVAAGSSLTGVAATSVITLTEGVLKAMLLAKLRYAVLSVATLALVSTSVGVFAQSGGGYGPVATDRLKAVEQKLDKLLEVLGRSHEPAVAAGATLPARSFATTPSAATASTSISATPAALAPATAHGLSSSRSSASSTGAHTLARGDVVGRVDRLERRLNELERRFSDLERRIAASDARAVQPTMPPPGLLLPSPEVPLVPPNPPVASGPLDDVNINTSGTPPLPTSRSIPSTDTPDGATPPPSTESIPLPSAGTDAPPDPQPSGSAVSIRL
jgi:RNA polymerase sigma factor (sigma-70 family)